MMHALLEPLYTLCVCLCVVGGEYLGNSSADAVSFFDSLSHIQHQQSVSCGLKTIVWLAALIKKSWIRKQRGIGTFVVSYNKKCFKL